MSQALSSIRLRLPPVVYSGLQILLLAAVYFVCARLSVRVMAHEGRLAPIWVPNALALTALLRSPLRRWPILIGACMCANLLGGLSLGNSPAAVVCLSISNAAEYSAAAVLLRHLLKGPIRMDRGSDLAILSLVSGAVAALSTGLASGSLWLFVGDQPNVSVRVWVLAHPLSLLVLTPTFLVISRAGEHLAERPFTLRAAASMALLVSCVLCVFLQTKAPVLFLIPPTLLVVSIEFGALGAATGMLITAAIAIVATGRGLGPLSLMHGDIFARACLMQMFLLTTLLSSLPVANLQARQRRLQTATLAEADRAARAERAAVESEARYRHLADHATDIIASFDLNGLLTYLSPSTRSVTGYAAEALLGETPLARVHRADRAALKTAFNDIVSGAREPGTPVEFRFRHKDGRWLWLETNPQVLRDNAGRAVGVMDIGRDITQRKWMEVELRAARAQAEAAAEVKSQFLANMSHELRTPLTAVIGFTSLIGERPELSSQTRQYVDRVRTAGTALLTTVNDVLDFSKLEAGQVDIRFASIDPRTLTEDVLQLFGAQAMAKGLLLRCEIDPATPDRVEIDADRVRQVLTNLIGNAVKFTTAGHVTVGLEYLDGRARFRVRDTGGGISEAAQALLFQRFSQVDASSTRRHGGTGLGLAICKGLVEAMGGTIGVASVPGAGSSFTFELPAPISAETAAALSPTSADVLGRHRILLAEDNPVNRELVKALLARFDLELEAVENGRQAVEAAAVAGFDLILMDLHMPELGGLEAARAIRSSNGPNAKTPIVAFSADVLKPQEAIFDGMVAKPIVPHELFNALAQHLNDPSDVTSDIQEGAVRSVG